MINLAVAWRVAARLINETNKESVAVTERRDNGGLN